MNDELEIILGNLLELCMANSHAIEQVLMMAGSDDQRYFAKCQRLEVMDSIQRTQSLCRTTLAQIVAARAVKIG